MVTFLPFLVPPFSLAKTQYSSNRLAQLSAVSVFVSTVTAPRGFQIDLAVHLLATATSCKCVLSTYDYWAAVKLGGCIVSMWVCKTTRHKPDNDE